jgi:hypothetical protein
MNMPPSDITMDSILDNLITAGQQANTSVPPTGWAGHDCHFLVEARNGGVLMIEMRDFLCEIAFVMIYVTHQTACC